MAATPGRFEVEDGEIIDTKARQIISLDQLAKLATPEEQDSIRQQIQDSGWAGADQTESSDSPALARGTVSRPSVTNTPSQQDALPSRPSLQQFMEVAKQDNPDVPDKDLRRYWAQNYSDIDPKTLPSLETFLAAAKEDNPGVPDQALKAYWNENYGDFGAAEKDTHLGIGGTIWEGAKSAGRSLKATGQALIGDESGVVDTANAQQSAPRDIALQNLLTDIQKRKDSLGKDPSWLATIGEMGKAALSNPKGAGLLLAEQLPNSAVALGSGLAGAAAGSALGPIGTIAGGIAGLFAANTALETGGKAIEAGADQSFTPDDRSRVLKEGLTKGAVITGVDVASLGLTNFITGTTARAVERATVKTLTDAGVDVTDRAAVMAATKNPDIFSAVQSAQQRAQVASNALGQRLARGSGAVGAEAVGEGAGEYLGEYAATGEADKMEAVIEAFAGLGQSAGEIAATHGLNRKREASALLQGPAPTAIESIPNQIGVGNPTVSIEQAIVNAQDILSAPVSSTRPQEDALSSRLAQLADSTASQREADRLESERQLQSGERLPSAQEASMQADGIPRTGQDIPLLEGPQSSPSTLPIADPSRLWMDESVVPGIEPGQAFTPRASSEPDAKARLQAERERLLSMRKSPSAPSDMAPPVMSEPPAQSDIPLQSAADLAYPPSERGRMPTQEDLALRDRGPAKRAAQQVPLIEGGEGGTAATIIPGATFSPRQEPVLTPKERLAAEREKLVRMKATRPAPMPSEPTVPPSSTPSDAPLRSAVDRAYPSVSELHDLARDKGFDVESPVFKTLTKMSTGKTHLDELSPSARDRFAETLKKLTPRETPTIVESPTKKALAPVQPGAADSDAVTAPRSALPPEQNAEMLLRAEKANADLESSSQMEDESLIDFLKSKGGLQDQGGELSTMEVDAQRNAFSKKLIQERGLTLDQAAELAHEAGYIQDRDIALLLDGIDKEVRGKGQHADWYRELTTGPKPMTRETIDTAVAKIIEDHGIDTGAAVERVKAALLNDGEFDGTQWGEDAASIARGDWPAWIPKPDAPPQQGATPQQEPVSASPSRKGTTTTPPQSEAATVPQEQPFTLTQEAAKADKPKPKATQLSIDVPPPTVGSRPIIGREVTPEEEPLFSESAKQPDAEQTDLTDGLSAFDNQSPYEQRSNEPAARNRALAREALAAIDGAASVHDQRGDIPRSGIPRPARPEEERLAGLERAGIRTPAVAISKDLATKGRVDLRGYTVTSMSDLATISQVLRNPRVETLRFFYVKNRKIVGHEGITSRMPGAAVAFPISRNDLEGMTVNERVDKQEGLAKDMIDRMERLGADGYYMLHNHPSGVSRPSRADIQLTRLFDQVLPGLLGHVVIDSNEYSTIDASGNVATHQLPAQKDAILEPYRPHRLLAPIIKDPESLATVGKAMQTTDGYITIVYVSGGDGKTRAIQEIPKKLFLNVREATNFLRGQSRAFGAMDALAYADTNDTEVWRAARELQKTGSLLDFAGMLNGKPESLSRHDQYKDYDHSFGVPHRLIGGMRVSDNASAPPSSQRSTISIDGIERPTMNSNGAPIAKTEESIRNFWKWFGNSQAVDAQGRPVVVYHGTGKKFTTFSKKRSTQGILWFTSNRDAVESGDVGAQGRGHIMELYAKVDRPAGWREYDRLLLAQFKGERLDGAILKEKNGQFDGFVFEPSQLKSAIGNSGAFDPNDSSIVKDEGIPYGTGTDYVRNSPDAKPSGRKLGGLLNTAKKNPSDDIGLTYDHLNNPHFSGLPDQEPERKTPSRHAFVKDLTAAQQAALARIHGTPQMWTQKLDAFKKTWKRDLIQGLFDQYAPILDYSKKGYILSRMAKSGDGTLEALMLYGKPYVDSEGAYRVDYTESGGMQGFSKVLSSLQGEHDRFLEWVAAQRAGRLKSVGLENLYNEHDIATLKTLNQGKMPDGASREAAYLKALSQLNEWNDAMVKIGVDSGLISDEAREQFKNVPYVPFYRLQEEGLVTGFGKKPGLVNQYAWKKLKGGTAHLNDDLLANLLQNWSHIITASAKNRAAKETLTAAKQAGVAEEIPSGAPGKGHVHYLENGKEVTFTVSDPALMDAVAALHYAGLGAIGKPFTAMKRALSFAVTVNPAYKIRNLIRDSIQAIGTSDLSYNPLKNMQQGAKATRHEAETRAQLLAGGGMMRFGSMLDGNDTTRTRRLIESGVDPETILSDAGAIEKVWKRLIQPAFQAYQEFGDRGEQLNRAALYEQLLKKGMTHQEASFWARDLMDFSMSGKWAGVRILTQVVPFLNARLQGLYKLGRATKQDYRKIATTLGAVALASIGLMLAYQDDEDWKKREDFDRENYWWFKVGNTAFRIPKPFEIGVVGTIAERSVEYLVSREMTGERFGERLAAVVFSQLSMNPTPQLVKPLMDLYANKDAFTGRPIETMGMERLRKEDRYTDRTSETAKFLGSLGLPDPAQLAMGRWNTLSPVQVDSLVRGYFSWLGSTTMTALDYGIRPMLNRGERPDMTLKEAFLVGNFAESLPNNSSRYMTQFYSQATEIEQAYNSYRDALKRGDSEGAASIMEDERDKLSQYHMVEHVKRQESKLNEQIKLIERSQRMSGEEKRARIDELQQRKQRLVERVNDRQLATR